MLLTGQPLHAYDYDKLKTLSSDEKIPTIVIRKPSEDESLVLLNGKEIKPSEKTILIATKNQAIGLGGVMGGQSSEVDRNTKTIALECATFDMYSIRRTSMENGIFSEAVTRFSRGQSSGQNIHILPKISTSIIKICDAQLEGGIVSVGKIDNKPEDVIVDQKFVNGLLGSDIYLTEMIKILNNVEINSTSKGTNLEISIPFWRTDISIKEDVVEEIGRLYGYSKLELSLPEKHIKPAVKNDFLVFKSRVRDLMSKAGANETISYSFVHGKLLDIVGQDQKLAFKLTNALSPDIQFYRLSLIPSLLDKIHSNVKSGYSDFVLFEMAKIIQKDIKDPIEPNLPEERYRLGIVLTDDVKKSDKFAPYYRAYRYLEFLLNSLGIRFRIQPINGQNEIDIEQLIKPFESIRSGLIFSGDDFIGILGEPNIKVITALKLPKKTSMIELDLTKLNELATKRTMYTRLSSYPKIEQDLCFRLPTAVSYHDLYDRVSNLIDKFEDKIIFNLMPLDIFQQSDEHTKQITLRLSLNSYTRTLKQDDLKPLLSGLSSMVKTELSGEII
jgi:phenylalanyl-tRNA synthetase beta chain